MEAEILLQNGFPNHGKEGYLFVGKVTKGQIKKNAVLIINNHKIKIDEIQFRENSKHDFTRIVFEVDRNLEPPIEWKKLFNSTIKVINIK